MATAQNKHFSTLGYFFTLLVVLALSSLLWLFALSLDHESDMPARQNSPLREKFERVLQESTPAPPASVILPTTFRPSVPNHKFERNINWQQVNNIRLRLSLY